LIDWCIWKYSSCEFVFAARGKYPNQNDDDFLWGDKYAARFYSDDAWKHLNKVSNKSSIKTDLRFDHVWTRCYLQKQILDNEFDDAITKKFIGCVLSNNDEHGKLNKEKQEWLRYEGKTIWGIKDLKPVCYLIRDGRLKKA